MGSHELAQACTLRINYKLISKEAADRPVEPPPIWQDGIFLLSFFFF